jgi:hypothetical protein
MKKKQWLFWSLKWATEPLLVITGLFPLSTIFLNDLNLSFMSTFLVIFKYKSDSSQHVSAQTKYRYFVTFLDIITPIMFSKTIWFHPLSSQQLCFRFGLQSLLLDKLSSYGLSTDSVNWFCSYLTNRQRHACFSGRFSSPFIALSSTHW